MENGIRVQCRSENWGVVTQDKEGASALGKAAGAPGRIAMAHGELSLETTRRHDAAFPLGAGAGSNPLGGRSGECDAAGKGEGAAVARKGRFLDGPGNATWKAVRTLRGPRPKDGGGIEFSR